ncbi:zeta toxin family protein [Spirosoma rhododendri]|uniref:AAA family ATPase n=1 Tax=Spirosoma rhododendri TaxID=2728024 RepID=A0A7L5DRN8_9BACT|nr:zeta toxin family protein [Spirosoma rhododendri]QJD81119.1 AAA family ATPase [Spirosoma rhododendri]
MSHQYERLLVSAGQVNDFLTRTLDYDCSAEQQYVAKIAECELSLSSYPLNHPTISSTEYRDSNYSSEPRRIILREQIVNELLTLERLESDELIKLQAGGALPHSLVVRDKNAYIIIGLPASGKSGIANRIADEHGAIIIDSDYAKRKLPEFALYGFGATLVHKESSALVLSASSSSSIGVSSLIMRCIGEGYNIVVPTVGDDDKDVLTFALSLRSQGYRVHLVLVNLDRQLATIRAFQRFKETGRYVPLSMIFDRYGNGPIQSYLTLKNDYKSSFASFGQIKTSGSKPVFHEGTAKSPAKLFK